MSIKGYRLYKLPIRVNMIRKDKFYVAMTCNLTQLIQNEIFMTCGRCKYYEEGRGCKCRELNPLKYLM